MSKYKSHEIISIFNETFTGQGTAELEKVFKCFDLKCPQLFYAFVYSVNIYLF